jgi:hypothetical protein
MRTLLSLLLIILAHGFLSAETKAQAQEYACPYVQILSTDGHLVPRFLHCSNYQVTLTARITNVAPEDKPTFNWTVSSGKVISGQGTSTATIAAGETLDEEITVTVEVGGVSALTQQCNHKGEALIGFSEPCCPTIFISCPTDLPIPGAPVPISVNISGVGVDKFNLKYKWQVSPGKIVGGQGTAVISVDITGIVGQSVVATVEIDGLPPECDRTESCSFSWTIELPTPESRKFDEYGQVSSVNEETRLSNFEIQLQQEPGTQGYVIIYGPRRVRAHLERARKFLIEKRGLEPSRLELIDGGYRKKTKVELWLRPTGAAEPIPQ